jgi:serine/threonine protein phosphatase PrpC
MAAKIRSWHLTDVGCVRDHNEDNGYADPEGRFFICSDGMGGHASGDIASSMAVQEISSRLAQWPAEIAQCARTQDTEDARRALAVIEAAVRAANDAIHRRGRNERDKRGMGCTVDVVAVAGSLALCAHVGDSRQYLIRDGHTRQITQDHSLAPPRLPGQPTQKAMLTSALGPNPTTRVDTFVIELREGDRLLMCTDGLADYFADERELGNTVAQRGEGPGAQWLIDQAKARGGADNITIVLIKVDRLDAPPIKQVPLVPAPAQDVKAVSYAATAPMAAQRPPTADPAVPQIVPPGVTPPKPKVEDKPPEVASNLMGTFTTSALFSGVTSNHIATMVGAIEPKTLMAGKPVPRQVNGLDTAWLILEGEYRGMLLYPEALLISQTEWSGRESPPETTKAIMISRSEFTRFCAAEPAVGVKLLQNVARLVATELKEQLDKK